MDDYAKDGVPGVVWALCSFYQDPFGRNFYVW